MTKKINEAFFLRPWAITEDVLNVMTEIVFRHLKGEKLSAEEISARIGDKKQPESKGYEVVNGTAVIPVLGVISKRMNMFQDISGGTSVELLRKNINSALDDESVKDLLLDIDSPGGSSDGIAEMADAIFAARGEKPITAYADGMMASAAYWLGSAADKVYASQDAAVGSIGVYAVLRDWSVYEHNLGVKTNIIKAGKYKASGHPSKPMSEDDKAVIQEEVDDIFGLFTTAIARNRGFTAEETAKVATGRVFIAQKAQDLGLIDGITTLEAILGKRDTGGNGSPIATRAEKSSAEVIDSDKQVLTSKKEELMSEVTVEQIKKDHPAVADALIKEGKEAAYKEGKEAGVAEGRKAGEDAARQAEQARVKEIMESMPKGMEAVCMECLKSGATVAEAKDKYLKALTAEAPKTPGANPDPQTETPKPAPAAISFEEQCRQDWETKKELHEEFASLETYTGYMRAKSRGRIRNVSKK